MSAMSEEEVLVPLMGTSASVHSSWRAEVQERLGRASTAARSRAVLAVLCTLLLCSALLNVYFMRPGADTRGQPQETRRFSFKGPGSVVEDGRSAKFWSKHSLSSKVGEERQNDKTEALGPFTPTDDLDVADKIYARWSAITGWKPLATGLRELRAAAGHAAGAVAEDARDAADVMLGDGNDVILGDDAWKDAADGALCSDGTADGILDALTGAEPDYFFFVLVGVAPGVEEDDEAVEDLKAWLQDHNGDNWDADNDEGKMHKVRLEDDVCGDGSQHEMAVWRYKDPAPTGCSAHIAQGLIDLAVAAAGDATSDSGDVLDIITSVEDDFEQAHLLVVAHNVLPGYWSPAHNLDESCAVNNTQVFYFIDPDTQ